MRVRRSFPRHSLRPYVPVRRVEAKFAPTGPEARRRFFEEYNAAYERLAQDPVAWAELMEERRVWDATLMDGLEDEPWYEGEPMSRDAA